MKSDTDFKNLLALSKSLDNAAPLSEKITQWLRVGLELLSTGQATSLDEALKLSAPPGGQHIGTRLYRLKRDRLIVEITGLIGDRHDSAWSKAKQTSQLIKKIVMKPERVFKKRQARLTPVERTILKLLVLDPNTPHSKYFIYNLLRNPLG